jgi:metal transporter CNNM
MAGSPASRPVVLSILKLLVFVIANLPFIGATPMAKSGSISVMDGKAPKDPSLWIYLGTAIALVLLGGAFAGLTIASV